MVRRRRWPRRLGTAALALLILIVVALAILWPMRIELARNYIDAELARRGVRASYEVRRIGFGSQIFENLVIGDPRRPDLTAARVEVRVLIGFTGPRIGLITARGVRMAGRLENGRVRLGEVDKLLPPPSGAPFRLPDQRVDVRDAALDLATPAGRVSLAFSGRGNLADGFRGGIAVVARELRVGGCTLTRPVARLTLRIADARPRVHGPAAIGRLACGADLVADRPLFAVQAIFSSALDHWRGTAATRVAALRAGPQRLTAIAGHVSFDGTAERAAGSVSVDAGPSALGAVRAAAIAVAGDYAAAPRRGHVSLQGTVRARGLTVTDAALAAVAGALRGARGTPAGPIGETLAEAVLRAGRGGAEGEAALALTSRNGEGELRFGALDVRSRSGARLTAPGGEAIIYAWPGGGLRFDRDFALSGGGFPAASFVLTRDAGGAIYGDGRIAPMQAGGARLALGDIAFAAGPDGRTSFRTSATLDGPFSGGRVRGLSLPVTGRFGAGGLVLGERCVAASFRALQVQSLAIGPTRLSLCPAGRAVIAPGRFGAELRAPRVAGHLGRTPIALAAARLRVDNGGFAATRVAVAAGAGGRVSRLDVASLAGRFAAGGGAAGRFEGAAGSLAGVPLDVGEGRGNWRLRGGTLALDGRLAVADARAPARFHPLAGEDFRLTLAGNRIHATGVLSHPASHMRVALATIDHDLASGAGHAVLDVPELRFTPAFQPEALTPLTLGIVALVDGSVTGRGRIEWDARGSRSAGTFSTADLNLAAPFGPVQGLATTIHFTDLLGLVSAPHQEARIRLVQPGIDVFDGVVHYQLRPDYHVAVERARWPLAGGTLTLEPAMLDFSRESTKHLTFRVEALDAARFIQQLEFSNIAATGTYDGVVPMRFTRAGGGEVIGGRLVARADGGTLSYVGELSDRDLGAYGVLAFDALKSLRYSRLSLTMDGALDGEFITRIEMDGVARNPAGTRDPSGGIRAMVAGRVLRQLARIPFHFNIRIEGRFRALIATARSFEDPRDLIRAALPQLLESRTPPDPIVQPQESEPMR